MRRPLTTVLAAATLAGCGAHAQVFDDFDDGLLEGWTSLASGGTTVGVVNGALVIGGNGESPGAARLDITLDLPDDYAEGETSFDLDLDIGGRPIEAGVELRGDPTTGAAMVFAVFPNNPGGPGASIALRESAEGPTFKLAAPAIPFDLSRVKFRVQWTETEYTLTVSMFDQSSPSVRFTVEVPAPSDGSALTLFARPTPGVGSGDWSARFDNFRASPPATRLCVADVNGDGVLSPADYNAWIIAFNSRAPECDQNGDDQCTPADFNGWIINWNAGCD